MTTSPLTPPSPADGGEGVPVLTPASARPDLPVPTRTRWQPLRLGLVELFHYDSEEFWFHDGHLLLRGNNGTGKSKVLSLTLPFLFDAQLKPSRIEPDGDAGKRMAWNLLVGSYERRVGYAWIEFGRLAEDGTPRYLTLGAGLSAVAAKPQVDAWYFLLEDPTGATGGHRLNRDLWLTTPQRSVLGRERLREALEGRGQVFETAATYRRAVDERLFKLGTQRYDALMDTLIQLRQPQLSKKPDETALSNALTEALPPLAPELLGDVADALGRLEEDRQQLAQYQKLAQAVDRFDQRYRVYAGTQSRRQARALRQAQTEFDNASRARSEAAARLETRQSDEAQAHEAHAQAGLHLGRQRARLDALREDPANQDANRLSAAEGDAIARRQAVHRAEGTQAQARQRERTAQTDSAHAASRLAEAEARLGALRRSAGALADTAGIATGHTANPLAALDSEALAALPPRACDTAAAELRSLSAARREQIALLQRRLAELASAQTLLHQRREARDERLHEAANATERRVQADAEFDRQGRSHTEAWAQCFDTLVQLRLPPDERQQVLQNLADWVLTLAGDNPARALLHAAQQHASQRLAEQRAALLAEDAALQSEQQTLLEERQRLEAGEDAAPPPPHTRAASVRDGQPGAPLWQLLDFADDASAPLPPEQRAGLEAALEAAGLLDAWLWPDGRLQSAGGELVWPAGWHDTRLLQRPATAASLTRWLRPAAPSCHAVAAEQVQRVLAGIACSEEDGGDTEAWIGLDGRFRLSALAGAWAKPAAVYIGYTARADARARRLTELAQRLASLAAQRSRVAAALAQLGLDQQTATAEWLSAPRDEPLREALVRAQHGGREAQVARAKLAQADTHHGEAEQAAQAAAQRLADDATDLHLPAAPDARTSALATVQAALEQYRDAQAELVQAVHALRLAMPDLQRHRSREAEAHADLQQADEQLAGARVEAEEAQARLEVLRESVGALVEELQRRMATAVAAVKTGETELKAASETWRRAGEARAIAEQQAATAATLLAERTAARAQAVNRLQHFAATGLLAAALPQLEQPESVAEWTIDPALSLARRVEQALASLKDDDDAWTRVQRDIQVELTTLQGALTALGQQAHGEQTDWGLVAHIVYQNRPERPDRLAARLAEEIALRSELLTAHEREVFEEHLQAEIAAEVQRLLQAAERQVDAINKELHKRPTSTGVRYRLLWQPLPEEDGAPAGLEAARKRLLNIGADLWTAEDRRVVGTLLQQRIAHERARADLAPGDLRGGLRGRAAEVGGSLLEQLARALDYRRWHRFRVERWQDGHWRKLAGPASSGERALGLTVPLFAAVASFYGQGSYTLAPRLMLLDEAFAGIDDAARAHCMGLIREFDLDFVITSEREWGCYAELPGVAICQLQRREGIDAVFVSRWYWDGCAKRREADPDRRYDPAS